MADWLIESLTERLESWLKDFAAYQVGGELGGA